MTDRRRSSHSTGAVYLEFLIAFPPLWIFGLCIFQLILLARADLIVRHAAESAARSAAVVLPDDPARYGGEPKMSVSREPEVEPEPLALPSSDSFGDGALSVVLTAISIDGLSRRETIAAAAQASLLPLGGTPRVRARRPTLESALGPSRIASVLGSSPAVFELDFSETNDERVQGPEVTVRVTYAFPCRVPIARHIICELDSGGKGSGVRVWLFDHSTTLLVHDAPYSYRTLGES